MKICLPHPEAESVRPARAMREIFAENFTKASQAREYCGGEGGFETWRDGEIVWVDCPQCHGSGWVEGEAEPLSLEDLDLRAPLDSLLAWWRCLATRGAWPEQRQRIAAMCDRRVTPHYRMLEC